jgi:hypothetical protein
LPNGSEHEKLQEVELIPVPASSSSPLPAQKQKIEALLRAFEENISEEAFLVTNDLLSELAGLLEKQQPIVALMVELLGAPQENEASDIQAFRERLARASERREATAEALQNKAGPLRAELAQLRQTTKTLQEWKKVWAAPDPEATNRLPTSYA